MSGFGTSMKFLQYYSTDGGEKRRQRRKPSRDSAEVLELRKKVETLEQEKVDSSTVSQLVKEGIRDFLPPGFMEGIAAWNAAGRQGSIHVPSYAGSTSSHMVTPPDQVVTPPANTVFEPPLHTMPQAPRTEAQEPPMQTPMPYNETPATVAIVSTLEELNAIDKVTN